MSFRPARPAARSTGRAAWIAIIGLACLTALGACGRRGPLEPPPAAQAPAADRTVAGGQPVVGQPVEIDHSSGALAASRPEDVSTFAGAVTVRPLRETDMAAPGPAGAPTAPQAPVAPVNTPGVTAVGPEQSGLTSGPRAARRSPPPNRAFILDPLL